VKTHHANAASHACCLGVFHALTARLGRPRGFFDAALDNAGFIPRLRPKGSSKTDGGWRRGFAPDGAVVGVGGVPGLIKMKSTRRFGRFPTNGIDTAFVVIEKVKV
jgi:hypothetical protein